MTGEKSAFSRPGTAPATSPKWCFSSLAFALACGSAGGAGPLGDGAGPADLEVAGGAGGAAAGGSGGAPIVGWAPSPTTGGAASGAGGAPPAVPPPPPEPTPRPYDPNTTFDWPEAAVQTGKCQPGTYAGTFRCTLDAASGLPPTEFSGPVNFTLQASVDGEFLDIENGTLRADFQGGFVPIQAELEGKLDCSTNRFEATLVNGTYTVFIVQGTFSGTMSGDLDRATSTVSGTWHLQDGANPALACQGSWSVAGAP